VSPLQGTWACPAATMVEGDRRRRRTWPYERCPRWAREREWARQWLWKEAFQLFGSMLEKGVKRNVIIWNTIAGQCLHSGHFRGAIKLLSHMTPSVRMDILCWSLDWMRVPTLGRRFTILRCKLALMCLTMWQMCWLLYIPGVEIFGMHLVLKVGLQP